VSAEIVCIQKNPTTKSIAVYSVSLRTHTTGT